MAEDATAKLLDSSIAPEGAPIVDQPQSSTSESDPTGEVHDAAKHDRTALLFIVDHVGYNFPIPWEQGRDFTRFKAYVEEIYARGYVSLLDDIRNNRFNATIHLAGEDRVVLPSLWQDFVQEGATVRISLIPDRIIYPTPPEPLRRERVVEFADVDVNAGHEERDKAGSETGSSEPTTSAQSEEEGSDTSGPASEDDEKAPGVALVAPVRAVNKAVDEDGNSLSFTVDTRWVTNHLFVGKEHGSSENSLTKNTRNNRSLTTETIKITRAITTTTENRTTLEIHTLPGPENSSHSSSVGIRWLHLHGDALDWTQFKNVCLMLPDLSERTKFLVTKTLHKIEKEYIKAFLGGMFIEPGTVLRGDECNQSDPESVVFSCTPYFDLQRPTQTSTQTGHSHPARTLIEAYYPYEPVRDRDEEQAYRKFSDARSDNLIHVPSLWMLNIAGKAVVTCGYGPLSRDFTRSIKVIEDDLKQLGSGKITCIRLAGLNGHTLFYTLQECATYFQLEQRLRELPRFISNLWYQDGAHLRFHRQGEDTEATPANWPAIIRQQDVIFIDVSVVEGKEKKESRALTASLLASSKGSVPPFYHWPSTLSKDEMSLDSPPKDVGHAIRCLEHVEKAMLNDILPEYDTGGPVDRTFTSTKYYESLPEDTFEDVDALLSTQDRMTGLGSRQTQFTHHQHIVRSKSSKLSSNAYEFSQIVHDTLGLFVGDVDKATLLRKVWGAMARIGAVVERLGSHKGYDLNPKEYTDPDWKTRKTGTRAWRIRTPTTSYTYANGDAAEFDLPLPDDDKEFAAALKRCRRCARAAPFDDPNAALKHLRNHATAEARKRNQSTPNTFFKDDGAWKDWICNDDQTLLESTIAGACAVLSRAIVEARIIYEQLQELADGVRNGQGSLSDLYSFPRKLLGTLHRLLVFYFAVERSLHYTEENFDKTKKGGYQEVYPYIEHGLEVLNRFSESVKAPLMQARVELCEMVRSSTPKDITGRMSWGAESISSWLIRRLIVKPLENSMSVGDMYRKYLTTLQFQVNHRPGKRLLRSIKLLQEELEILARVNGWQTQLVNNYIRVLDDTTYPVDMPSRSALFRYERLILDSCLENLTLMREEYEDQIDRCDPMSDSTKQSAEINEEDHGKAILVFTVVTVIFLPLSFVTSYLGMNTSDIRDMDSKQSLFWEISLPLTVGVMVVMLAIAYNGDEIRDFTSAIYRSVTGKQDRSLSARGISVLQRKRAVKNPADSAASLSMVDDAEYATPNSKPNYYEPGYGYDYSQPDMRVFREEEWYPGDRERDRERRPSSRHTRRPTRTPFPPSSKRIYTSGPPSPEVDIIPYSYTEQITYADRIDTRTGYPPPPPPPDEMPSRRTPPPPSSYANASYRPPTHLRIHKKYIVPSVLDDAYLPWEYDTDPNYIIIKRHLPKWETDDLLEKSKQLKEGTATTRFGGRGSYGRGEYVWESKKDKKKRTRSVGMRGSDTRERGYYGGMEL